MGFNFNRLLKKVQPEEMKSIGGLLGTPTPAPALSGLLSAPSTLAVGQQAAAPAGLEAFTRTPGTYQGQGESASIGPDTWTVNQAYLDALNNNKGAAPAENAYWVPAEAFNADANGANPGSAASNGQNPYQITGGFWNTPDPDGNGWFEQLSSGVEDFSKSPMAPVLLAMVTAGAGGFGGVGAEGAAAAGAADAGIGSGLAAATEAAAAPLAVGGMSAEAAAALAAIPEFAVAPALAGAGTGLLAAQQAAAAPITAGAADLGALSAVPEFAAAPAAGSGLLAAQQTASAPISVAPADMGALSAVPEFAAAPAVAPAAFNAAADSQLASQQLGITGAQSAASATAPATVNLVNAGGTMATAGGLKGAADVAAQALRDATASSEIGGSAASQLGSSAANALSSVGSGAGSALQFLKDNPTLGKLLFAGGTSLLSTLGSDNGSSGGGGLLSAGPAKQWNSPIQQGLLRQPTLVNPAAIQPTGNANSGAWRWMKG